MDGYSNIKFGIVLLIRTELYEGQTDDSLWVNLEYEFYD